MPTKEALTWNQQVDDKTDHSEVDKAHIDVVSIYDYNEEEISKLENQLVRAISLLMLIARCLPNFEHRLKRGQKEAIIRTIYQLPNKIFYAWAQETELAPERCGFRVIAAVAAVAEHSILHQYAAGRPDQQDTEELQRFSRAILEEHHQGKRVLAAALPGNRPYKKAGGVGMVPKAGSGCTGCGLCAEQCPTQAISPDDLRKADAEKCISCMRCVVHCPQGARKVNGALLSAAGLALKKACSVRKECELFL